MALSQEYRRDGFAFRPGLLSTTEVDVLLAEHSRLLAGEQRPDRVVFEKDGVTPRTLLNPQLHTEVFERLTRHPSILAVAQDLLDDDVYVFQMGVNCKGAFHGDSWFWHQDYPGYFYDDHIPAPRMVNSLIFLDEVTSFNGPLMMVPGSHTHVPPEPEVSDGGTSYSFRYADAATIEQQITASGIVAPTGPPGSVVFMHVNTLHGSAGNLSPWPRRMVTLTYNAMSNKATSPSVRPRHIVADDRDAPALRALEATCLTR